MAEERDEAGDVGLYTDEGDTGESLYTDKYFSFISSDNCTNPTVRDFSTSTSVAHVGLGSTLSRSHVESNSLKHVSESTGWFLLITSSLAGFILSLRPMLYHFVQAS